MKTEAEGTPFDDVFRTMVEKCTKLLIPVINEIFGTDYDLREQAQPMANEHFFTDENGNRQKRITDSYVRIRDNSYHIECECKSGDYIAIRMAEYDFHVALSEYEREAKGQNKEYILNFPKSAVLYLRHNSHTKEELSVRMILPDKTEAVYKVPTIKVQEYDKDDIIKKKLMFFVPFYILKYEKQLKELNKDTRLLKELSQDYSKLYEALEVLQEKGELSQSYVHNIIKLTENLIEIVASNADNVKKEVVSMGGKVLELESEKLLQKGMEEGREEGQRCMAKSIFGMMTKLHLSFEEACDISDIPKEQHDLYKKLVEELYK